MAANVGRGTASRRFCRGCSCIIIASAWSNPPCLSRLSASRFMADNCSVVRRYHSSAVKSGLGWSTGCRGAGVQAMRDVKADSVRSRRTDSGYPRDGNVTIPDSEKYRMQMVARDGIEPPTPAFSGLLTGSPTQIDHRPKSNRLQVLRQNLGLASKGCTRPWLLSGKQSDREEERA
jgi:hypothetical protein